MEFYIFVTKACNLNCKYCSETDFMKISRNMQNELDVKKTANFILNNLDKGRNNVVFYGGEPLLNQTWIKNFIEIAKNNNLTFTLQTNGTMLDKIDNHILKNLDFIHLSIDGNKEFTDKSRGEGVYDKILINLLEIKPKFRGKLLARMTLIPENSVFNSMIHLANLGLFDYFYWQLENSSQKIDYQKTKEYYREEIQKLADFWIKNLENGKIIKIVPFHAITLSLLNKKQHKSYRCGAGTYLVSIDSDGSCYSCDELLEHQFKIGSTTNGIQQKQLLSQNYSNFCLNCDIQKICGGRCFKSSIKFPTEKFRFYCDMTKILVKELREKIPEIESFIQNGTIAIKDLKYDCFTEEIP